MVSEETLGENDEENASERKDGRMIPKEKSLNMN